MAHIISNWVHMQSVFLAAGIYRTMEVASTRKMSRVVITAVLVLTTALCELILCVFVPHCCFSEKKLLALGCCNVLFVFF